MIHYITHYDKNYFAQARTMIESLRRFDKKSIITPVRLSPRTQIEGYTDADVLDLAERVFHIPIEEIKSNRTWKEFCWTLEPILLYSSLRLWKSYNYIFVYVDADSYFFSNPTPIIEAAMERADVALTPHHFPPGQEHRE